MLETGARAKREARRRDLRQIRAQGFNAIRCRLDWTLAAPVDYYGTSFFPKHSAFVDRDVEWQGSCGSRPGGFRVGA